MLCPRGGARWTPGARLAGFIAGFIKKTTIICYKEDHYNMLHTKYESFGPCGFGEEDFLKFFQ